MASRKSSIKSEFVPQSFEVGLNELDTIIQKLESGALPLAQALEEYQKGGELLVFCQKQLQVAEDQMKILENNILQSFNINNE